MKTEYHIIWVDDELDTVEIDISDTIEFLSNFGIEAKIKTLEAIGGIDIQEKIKTELQDPELDLIVVDFLMPDVKGDTLIDNIRTSDHVFLPVIFYSQNGIKALFTQVEELQLDGVYIAHRDRLIDKIKEVTTSLLRKEQTTKRTRGLLMEGVSEIDANFGKLFINLWDILNDNQKQILILYLKEKLSERKSNTDKFIEKIPDSLDEFRSSMENNFVSQKFDTYMRWKVIKKAFSLLDNNSDEVEIFYRLFDRRNGSEPLAVMRNKYGHKTREELERTHNPELCKYIREELRNQLNNMMTLLSK